MIDTKLLESRNFLKEMDPRLKIISGFLYSFIVAVEKKFLFLIYLSALPLFLIIFLPDIKNLFKNLIPVNVFLLFLWILIPFTYPGEKTSFFFLKLSEEGIRYCWMITLKANLIVITTTLLLSTSPFLHIIHALHHLKLPEKLVNLFYFFSRYIPVLNRETTRLRISMKARSFFPKTSIHTYKTYGNLVGMIILNSYNRAGKVYTAMKARSFSGTFWTKNHFIWKKKDNITSLIFTLYFITYFILKWLQ